MTEASAGRRQNAWQRRKSMTLQERQRAIVSVMPTISAFYGVTIRMYPGDHAPPHFHAAYAEHDAIVEIKTLRVIRGMLPPRAAALTLDWAALHREELLEDWELCATNQAPNRIAPLD